MRILVLSDIHGVVPAPAVSIAPKTDAVLVSGDITHFGGRDDAASVLKDIAPAGWAAFMVPGNCDGYEVSRLLDEKDISVDGKIRYLEGIPVYGLGGALPGPGHTPREVSEEDFEKAFDALFGQSELEGGILVCHQPPYKCKLDKAMGIRHVGSRAVRRFIERSRPLLCISGHIHESSGIDRIGDTLLINPGPFRHGRYALCEIVNGKVTCRIEGI